MKKRYIVKRIWVILLAVAAMLAAAGGTLAIYTSQVYQRAVVRNRYNDVIRFSSDKLYRVTTGADAQKYYYPMGQDQKTMTFSVCNYDQEKNTLFNEKAIDYKITFNITKGSANNYTISWGNQPEETTTVGNEGSVTIENKSLQGGKRSVDFYTVSFYEEDYNKVEITVTVTPTDSTVTQNRILKAVLIPIEYATTQGVGINWEFTDSTRGQPDQFDAYNLLVSVSGGERNVLITWNHKSLDIDPCFASGKPITKNEDQSTITVPMNSEDATGTYLISFYNHNNTQPGWTKWSDLPISVNLEEPPSNPTTQ